MRVVDYINIEEVLNLTLVDSIITITQPVLKGVFLMLYCYL
jgi:hypothetical protein